MEKTSMNKKILRYFSLFCMFAFFVLGPLPCHAEVVTDQGSADAIDITRKIVLPNPSVVESILEKRKDVEEHNMFYVLAENGLFKGAHNTFYQNAIDMPLTRFALGNVQLNMDGFRRLMEESESNFSRFDQLQSIFDAAPRVFQHLMIRIPFFVLFMAFMAQLIVIGHHGMLHAKGFQAVPLQTIVFRFFFFIFALIFYTKYVPGLITFSNIIADFLVPIEAQNAMMNSIIASSVFPALVPSQTFTLGNMMAVFFRALTYICIKILIIARDTLMLMCVLTGPLCIAMGFFTTYGQEGDDPLRSYLSGWIKTFATLLFWGPLAAMVLNAQVIIGMLSGAGEVSASATAIFGIASLFAAKDIPKMSEQFGAAALASMAAILAPATTMLLGGSLSHGVRGMGYLGGRGLRGLGRLGRAGRNFLTGDPIAGTSAGTSFAKGAPLHGQSDGSDPIAGTTGNTTGGNDTYSSGTNEADPMASTITSKDNAAMTPPPTSAPHKKGKMRRIANGLWKGVKSGDWGQFKNSWNDLWQDVAEKTNSEDYDPKG